MWNSDDHIGDKLFFENCGQEIVPLTRSEIQEIYSARIDPYKFLISWFRYPQGIRTVLETSGVLRTELRVLDAGCGFGAATFAFVEALRNKDLGYCAIDAFDLTPAMLSRFKTTLNTRRYS